MAAWQEIEIGPLIGRTRTGDTSSGDKDLMIEPNVWPQQPREDKFPLGHRVIPLPADLGSGEPPEVRSRVKEIGLAFLETGLEAFRARVLPKQTPSKGDTRDEHELPPATPVAASSGVSSRQNVMLWVLGGLGILIILRVAHKAY